MFVSLRLAYTLALGTKMLLTFNSFHTSKNLDLTIIQFLSKQLPLTYSFFIFFLVSSFLLVTTIYYFSESIGLNQELEFYATFIYVTSVSTYVFLSKVPLIYDSTLLIFFIAMLYSLAKMELQGDKKFINFLIFLISWSVLVFLANISIQILIFSFLAIMILVNFHKGISFFKSKIAIIAAFGITVYIILEKNPSYFYIPFFITLLFIIAYSLNKKAKEKIKHYLVKVQNKVTILKKPSTLLLVFIVTIGSSMFFSSIDKNFSCAVASLIINFYFFVIGFFFSKNASKTIELFVLLTLLIYFFGLGFNFSMPFEYFANYLVLISSPISGAGMQELIENSNLADRYIFVYIISYFSILLLAIPLFVF